MSEVENASEVLSLIEGEDLGLDDARRVRARVHEEPKERKALEAYAEETTRARAAARSDEKKRSLSLRLGVALWALKRYAEAAEVLAGAGSSGVGLFLRGVCLEATGDAAGAVAAFERASRRGVDAFEADLARAAALRRSGDFAAARKIVRTYEKSHDDRAPFHYEAARLLEAEGRYEEALEAFERALERDPEHTPSLFRMAYLFDMRGEDERAIELYRRCAEQRPTYANALINLGVLLEQRGEYDAAVRCYRRVLEAEPRHERARLFLKDALASKVMYYDEEVEKRLSRTSRVLRSPITDFELSVRSRNCLKKMNINTLGDLVRYTEEELLSFKNFGETSLAEIKRVLISKGLRLGMKVDALDRAAILPEPVPSTLGREQQQALMEPIEQLELSVRSRKCLATLGIVTVGDLIAKTPDELLQVKNFGQTSLQEVQEKLQQLGLSLNESPQAET